MKNNFYNKRNISLSRWFSLSLSLLQRQRKKKSFTHFRAQLTLTVQTDNIAEELNTTLNTTLTVIGAEVIHIYDTLSLHNTITVFTRFIFPESFYFSSIQ